MKLKQSLMTALIGIAMMIAMPVAAAAGNQHSDEYQDLHWQAPGPVIPVGHHYGWRNHSHYDSALICDEDGDDCHSSMWSDDEEDDCEPFAGYEDQDYSSSYYNNRAYPAAPAFSSPTASGLLGGL